MGERHDPDINEETIITYQEETVDIGNEVQLWLHSMGQGSPTIILEGPGPRCDSEPWMTIQPRLAQLTRTCRYDRAGTGKSSGTELSMPAIPPRTHDLEKLLEAAFIEPPYIMVGYSLGGAIVQRYAHQHLDHMAGLVLIESVTESLLSHGTSEISGAVSDGSQLSSFGDIPLIVVTIDTQEYILPPMPNVSSEDALKIWLATQAELVTLSSRGEQIFVKHTNHYGILTTHADDVIRAITMVVQEAR